MQTRCRQSTTLPSFNWESLRIPRTLRTDLQRCASANEVNFSFEAGLHCCSSLYNTSTVRHTTQQRNTSIGYEARPKERSDRGRFLPLGKKAFSYLVCIQQGAHRMIHTRYVTPPPLDDDSLSRFSESIYLLHAKQGRGAKENEKAGFRKTRRDLSMDAPSGLALARSLSVEEKTALENRPSGCVCATIYVACYLYTHGDI